MPHPLHSHWTKTCLHSLESGGSFQRPPSTGGLQGACWAPLPRGEGPKLGWLIRSDCPPQWWKTVPLLILFCDKACRAGQGGVRCGAAAGGYGGGAGGQRGCRHVTTHTCTRINTYMCADRLGHAHSLMQGCSVIMALSRFDHSSLLPFLYSSASPHVVPQYRPISFPLCCVGMLHILHSLPVGVE